MHLRFASEGIRECGWVLRSRTRHEFIYHRRQLMGTWLGLLCAIYHNTLEVFCNWKLKEGNTAVYQQRSLHCFPYTKPHRFFVIQVKWVVWILAKCVCAHIILFLKEKWILLCAFVICLLLHWSLYFESCRRPLNTLLKPLESTVEKGRFNARALTLLSCSLIVK